MCFSTKDIMGLFGNDKDFKLEDDSDKVDDTSTINKSEENKSFKSNIKI